MCIFGRMEKCAGLETNNEYGSSERAATKRSTRLGKQLAESGEDKKGRKRHTDLRGVVPIVDWADCVGTSGMLVYSWGSCCCCSLPILLSFSLSN